MNVATKSLTNVTVGTILDHYKTGSNDQYIVSEVYGEYFIAHHKEHKDTVFLFDKTGQALGAKCSRYGADFKLVPRSELEVAIVYNDQSSINWETLTSKMLYPYTDNRWHFLVRNFNDNSTIRLLNYLELEAFIDEEF